MILLMKEVNGLNVRHANSGIIVNVWESLSENLI